MAAPADATNEDIRAIMDADASCQIYTLLRLMVRNRKYKPKIKRRVEKIMQTIPRGGIPVKWTRTVFEVDAAGSQVYTAAGEAASADETVEFMIRPAVLVRKRVGDSAAAVAWYEDAEDAGESFVTNSPEVPWALDVSLLPPPGHPDHREVYSMISTYLSIVMTASRHLYNARARAAFNAFQVPEREFPELDFEKLSYERSSGTLFYDEAGDYRIGVEFLVLSADGAAPAPCDN